MAGELKGFFDNSTPGLDRLVRKAEASDQLTERVRAQLPMELRPHLLSAVERKGELVLIVKSAAWAARVRYCGPALRKSLVSGDVPGPTRVRVKVRGPA